MNKKAGKTAIVLMLFFVVISFGFGVYVGTRQVPAVDRVFGIANKGSDPLYLGSSDVQDVDFAPFWRVWNTLNSKFVPRSTSTDAHIDPQDKVWSAIDGLVSAYDDPYTVFFKPEETEIFKESTKGSFEGIGAIIGIRNEKLAVIAPLEDSPAQAAGLLAGDIILKIDGEDAIDLPTDLAVEKIRGERGTTVTLTVRRGSTKEELDITITRGKIDIPSTDTAVIKREVTVAKPSAANKTKVVIDPETNEEKIVPVPVEELSPDEVEVIEQDFFALQLYSFSESSVRSFKKGLEEFAEADTNKLIIDLRGNPGGFLEAAVDMASFFLEEGEVVVREIVGAEQTERVHRSKGHTLLNNVEDLKLVILVNRGSASASEILAGALQEYGVATLVGEKTFGKGSVQELVDITGDISLKVTIARWFTPKGVSISEHGLTPDIVVDMKNPPEGVIDPMFEEAVRFLSTD